MFLHLSVILFTGGCVSQHTMGRGHILWADTSPGRHLTRQIPPPQQTPTSQADPQADTPRQTPPPPQDGH